MTHLLVLAGTGEARQLLAQLATNPNICITASLAGATDRPAAFGVETRIGGFGGVEVVCRFLRVRGVPARPPVRSWIVCPSSISLRCIVWFGAYAECWVVRVSTASPNSAQNIE